MAAECSVLHENATIHKGEEYRGLQISGVTHFLLPNTACIFLQKTEIKGIIKEAKQENEMLLSWGYH